MSAGNWKEMFLACGTGDLELVRYHILMGANPNYQHPEFMSSPLIECIRNNQLEIAQFLLENGADPFLKEGFGGDDALKIAKQLKNKEAIGLLQRYR